MGFVSFGAWWWLGETNLGLV